MAALPPSQTGKAPRDLNHAGATPSPVHQKSEQRADKTGVLRQELQASALRADRLREQLNRLEGDLAERNSALDRSSQDRAELERQLSLAQTNAGTLQERLNVIAS